MALKVDVGFHQGASAYPAAHVSSRASRGCLYFAQQLDTASVFPLVMPSQEPTSSPADPPPGLFGTGTAGSHGTRSAPHVCPYSIPLCFSDHFSKLPSSLKNFCYSYNKLEAAYGAIVCVFTKHSLFHRPYY